MASQKDIKGRINSVKNIRKITRAMEMVAAARLRRAEQRIEQLRPYADAIRRMTRRATEAAENIPNLPLLQEHDSIDRVGFLLVTGDRGLAGAFNSQIVRAGNRRRGEVESDGKQVAWYASGRRGVSSIQFRGLELADGFTGFTDRPSYSDARNIADALIAAYVDGDIDRVEIFYNGYISPLNQEVRHETLLPLQQADVLGDEEGSDEEASTEQREEKEKEGEERQDGERKTGIGRVEEIQGVVIEAVFTEGELPEINTALEIEMTAAGEGEASPSIGLRDEEETKES